MFVCYLRYQLIIVFGPHIIKSEVITSNVNYFTSFEKYIYLLNNFIKYLVCCF